MEQRSLDEQESSDNPTHLYELFEQAANRFPKLKAFVQDENSMNYEEGKQSIDAAALYLKEKYNVQPGDVIGLLLQNSIEYELLVFAGLKIGAIVLPLNIRLTIKELTYIINHALPKIVIGEKEVQELMQNIEKETSQQEVHWVLHDSSFFMHVPENEMAPQKRHVNDGAFLIYTSGTTGRPKGALLHHEGVIHTVLNYEERLQTSENTTTLIAVPMFHVTGLIGQMIHMVRVGGTSVILKRYQTERFLEVLDKKDVNFLFNVPTMYQMILQSALGKQMEPIQKVKTIAFGGAPLDMKLYQSVQLLFPEADLHNTYGATETSSPTTIMPKYYPVAKQESVGQAISHTELKVVDEEGEICPNGEVGELWIKGPMVIKEYWLNEKATQVNFENGYWKSGDFAVIDEDGYVYIKDRKKDSINRGGEKIYSIEVEKVLNQHPSVYESAVVGIRDPLYGEVVKAYVTLHKDKSLSDVELRNYAKGFLSTFKLPEIIEFRESLPKNAGGKFLKHLLRN
ncbi:class I adenylate-forming enzyme family protein [Shouchella shacheensis]|uniref:class I adenylate-forming enzyme family protein n=1 Tax=Shouchella shacheensis TaxID=1649580 RepID=UPI00073FCAF5|nr:class I adenylate-forming enzyme family protein [Shouchella shacheensis]